MKNYVCKIATIEEMNSKWDYEIILNKNDNNWLIWKEENINNFQNGKIIPYYGLLGREIICEATAMLSPEIVQNRDGLVSDKTAYLSAFRTNKEYQGQKYFSQLFKYMIADLKEKGYVRVTLGVEPEEIINKEIYTHYGFTEHIKDSYEEFPDGTRIKVEYYGKSLD